MNCFFLIIFITLFQFNIYSMTIEQAQDVRFHKGESYIQIGQEKKGLLFFSKNLEGPFHYKTEKFLADYFFTKREFTKSYDRYSNILRNTFDKNIFNFRYSSDRKENFLRVLSKSFKSSGQSLEVSFQVASAIFKFYELKVFSEEFNIRLLEESEKYFTICEQYNIKKADSLFLLSRIYFEKKQDDLAIKYLRETLASLQKDSTKSSLKVEDIQILLSETLSRKGEFEKGIFHLRKLLTQKESSAFAKDYAELFLNELDTSFMRIEFLYKVNNQQNVHQLPSELYKNFDNLGLSNSLGEKDALLHHRRASIIFNNKVDSNTFIKSYFFYLNESPFNDSLEGPANDRTVFDITLTRYRTIPSFWEFNYHFEKLSGKNLATLNPIQPLMRHRFSFNYRWFESNSKWKLSFPFEIQKFRNFSYNSLNNVNERSSTLLGTSLIFNSDKTSYWFNPVASLNLGLKFEGQGLGQSKSLHFAAGNDLKFYKDFYWYLGIDFLNNSNPNEILKYNEIGLQQLLTIPTHRKSPINIEANFNVRSRTYFTSSITFLEFGLGASFSL